MEPENTTTANVPSTAPAGGAPAPRPKEFRTTDIRCLECGAYNIPENMICGRCGASLPVIYDKDGKLFRWETDSPYWESLHPSKKKGVGPSGASGWVLRGVILLAAALFALWVFARRG